MKKTSLIVAFAAMVPPASAELANEFVAPRVDGMDAPNKQDSHFTKLGAMSPQARPGVAPGSFSGITSKLISDALAS